MSEPAVEEKLSVPDPVPAISAATVVLLRDGVDGVEVLMLRRNPKTPFAPGAVVFPGGKLHDADSAPELGSRMAGGEGPAALNALRVAAIREAFEETGIFLGTRGGQALSPEESASLRKRYRRAVLADPWKFPEMLRDQGLELPLGDIAYAANWVTPNPLPRRFDAHFFLCRAPMDPTADADGGEILALEWVNPAELITRDQGGHRFLMLPTRLVLSKFCCTDTVDQALASVAADIQRIEPEVILIGQDIFLDIPEDSGYGVTRVAREDMAEHLAGLIPEQSGE